MSNSTQQQWHAGEVEANGLRIHYTRTGGDKPALVLAHGVTDSGLCWAPIAEALAETYDVIMVDARGHGQSEAADHGYDAVTQAADLAGVITALQLQQPFVLGHSMGAVTALALAGAYPDLPRAIVLEDPPGFWEAASAPTPADPERMAQMQTWFKKLKQKTRAELIAEQHAASPNWPEAELGPWADAKLRVAESVFRIFDAKTPLAIDWQTLLPRISCPALLITADRDLGSALSDEGAASLHALVPQLQIIHIAGAGHNIRREQPQQFLEVVRAFLAR